MKYLVERFCFEIMFVDFFKRYAWLCLLYSLDFFHFPFVVFNDFMAILEKRVHASNDGLWIEITEKALIEARLEIEEE